MPRVIAIQGFAQDSRGLINNEPESTEIWGMNNGQKYLRDPMRAKRWFQIHPRDWNAHKGLPAGEYGREDGHAEWLSKFPGELYLQYPDERVPNAKVYPYAEVIKFLNRRLNRDDAYLTSTFAYMFALALYEHSRAKKASDKISEIKVFGINLTTSEEYFNQRPCVEWLIGQAQGMGISVWLPPTSAILRGRGYAREDRAGADEMFQQRVEHWRGEHQKRRDLLTAASYVLLEVKSWIASAEQQPDMDIPATMKVRLSHLRNMANNLTAQVEASAAAFREAQHALSSMGQVYIPRAEFEPIVLATVPIGYDNVEVLDDRTRPDPAGLSPNAEPVAAGGNG